MKTVILHLEPHDDILSVLDRLTWVKGHQALLIWPEEGCGLETRLDFVRLARQARALNLRLALVTQAPQTTTLAAEVGLPVFATREEALRRPWARRRRRRRLRRPAPRDLPAMREALQRLEPTWERHPAVRLLAFTAGVLAVLALAAFLLPGASVTLMPVASWQEVALTVRASPNYSSVTLDGRVPARWIEVTVSGEDDLLPTGLTRVPYRAASAVLRFTNLTDQAITIPEGTLVISRSHPTIRFAVEREGTVAPGGTLVLPARAVQPGTQGNLPADDLQGLEPPLAFQLRVTNPYPATGGEDQEVPAPTAADQARLRRRLQERLAAEALQRLQDAAGEKWLLTASLRRAATLEEIFSAEPGEPANQLHLTLREVYRGLVVDPQDVTLLARQVLDARLPSGQIPVADSLQVQRLTAPQTDLDQQEVYHWRILTRRMVLPRLDTEALAQGLSGQRPTQATEWLSQQVPLTQPPQITLQPPWWPRLPWLALRIQVQVQAPTPDG